MKRRSLFSILFGSVAASAQSDVACPPTAPAWECGPAKNGQCPVCGTMAHPGKSGFVLMAIRESLVTMIRCARCSSAFFIDAEDRE